MSDPVIKGAKRSSSRPAPHSAAHKAPAKGRKLTAEAAKPKPKRAAAAKAPCAKSRPRQVFQLQLRNRPNRCARRPNRPRRRRNRRRKPLRRPGPPRRPPKPSGRRTRPLRRPRPRRKRRPRSRLSPSRARPRRQRRPGRPLRSPPATRRPRQPSRDEAAALKAFERAHKDFTRGNFAAAREHFRTLIEQHSGVSEVAARARTYLNIAETRLRSEATLPRDPDSLYDRGVIELNRGDFVAAQELFERALKRDPDAADTHYALAAARARLGAVESSLQALERALELKPVLRVRAQADADLALLRNDPEFERIVFPNSRP